MMVAGSMTRNRIRTTQELEELATEMAAAGFSDEEITKYLDFEKKRAVRHGFGMGTAEGDREASGTEEPLCAAGNVYSNDLVIQTLFEMATSGKNATATMFWLRCRAGWSPKGRDDLDDEDVEMVFGPYPKDVH
jgi:hypothetical protein